MFKIEIFSISEKVWQPEREVVVKLLKRMAIAGLRSDWENCGALSKYALIFCDNFSDTNVIEARRETGRHKWKFFTDSGHELNA